MFKSSVIWENSYLISAVSHYKCLLSPFNYISCLLYENIEKQVSIFYWVNKVDLVNAKDMNYVEFTPSSSVSTSNYEKISFIFYSTSSVFL